MRRALVLGGTGAVGSAVLSQLSRLGIPAVFTYHSSHERAAEIQRDSDHHPIDLDLADTSAVRSRMSELANDKTPPDIAIHCAAVVAGSQLADISDDDWQRAQRIGCQSALIMCQCLAPRWIEQRRGDVVFVGALDRTQSLPLPIAFSATQGMLSTMTMALANELGPHDIRVNMVALGLLDRGLSTRISSTLYRDFHKFSALRRSGTPDEAARLITWVAVHNEYMNGKVISANGGI